MYKKGYRVFGQKVKYIRSDKILNRSVRKAKPWNALSFYIFKMTLNRGGIFPRQLAERYNTQPYIHML